MLSVLMAACVAAGAGTLRDNAWMWGHDPGVYDGRGNEYNIPLSDPVPMSEACRRFGEWCTMQFTQPPPAAIRATLRAMPSGVRREMKMVLFWTWCGADLASIERNFAAYRAVAPKMRTLLGIYMWDFGDERPIVASARSSSSPHFASFHPDKGKRQ